MNRIKQVHAPASRPGTKVYLIPVMGDWYNGIVSAAYSDVNTESFRDAVTVRTIQLAFGFRQRRIRTDVKGAQ